MNKLLSDYGTDVAAICNLHQKTLFAFEPSDVEAFKLRILQHRFNALKEKLSALQKLSAIQGVTEINNLDDAASILFQHTVYKSYPMPFLENGRFDALTKWFSQLTTVDLSDINAKDCELVEEWLELLTEKTDLAPIHTTGTSGKLSFLPRHKHDFSTQIRCVLARWQGFGDERDVSLDLDNPPKRLPIIQPSYRYGYYMAQRLMAEQIKVIGDEDKVESLYNETLSPDVLSLSGRVATAQAKGQEDKLRISPALLKRFKESKEKAANKAELDSALFDRILARFHGEQVMVGNTVPQLFEWAQEGKRRGLKGIFSPDSLISSGGGSKGIELPEDWREQIEEVVGAPIALAYGMSELCAMANMCSHGHYHVPVYLICYVLAEDTGEPLPRKGIQTGRAAFFDMIPETYWGGFITGDEITVNWDGECGCGRKGEYIHADIRRFSEKNGSDDKISCSGAPDAQKKAMEFLAEAAADL